VGDFIEVEGISGVVEDIGWRSTRVLTLQDKYVVIPNSKLAESTIINNSLPEPNINIFVECGVAYESDLKKVEEVTLDVARDVQKTLPGAVRDYEPLMRYRNFSESNIDFIVILRVEKPMDQFPVRHEFIKALKERYNKEGIEISWPIRKIYNIR
jgi:small-conductance mechanosensitive channel